MEPRKVLKAGCAGILCNSTVILSRDYRKLSIESVKFLSNGCKYAIDFIYAITCSGDYLI
jgi:hypothetical protein